MRASTLCLQFKAETRPLALEVAEHERARIPRRLRQAQLISIGTQSMRPRDSATRRKASVPPSRSTMRSANDPPAAASPARWRTAAGSPPASSARRGSQGMPIERLEFRNAIDPAASKILRVGSDRGDRLRTRPDMRRLLLDCGIRRCPAVDVEARLETKGPVRCDHAVRDLWICSYEPDPGSDSYAEVTVRRGEDDCWVARRSRVTSESKPYSKRSFSFGRHEATGPVLRGCI